MTQAADWVAYRGAPLYDEDGNVIGVIEEFYVEADDAPPAWALVVDEGSAGGGDTATRSYVPMRDARRAEDGQGLQVSVPGDTVRNSPRAEGGGDLSGDEERRLYEHYGQNYPGGDDSAPGRTGESGQTGEERRPGLLRRLLDRLTGGG